MDCEKNQMRAGLLIDAALDGSGQVGLYRHLEECAGCRSFLDSMIRFRNTARIDRERIESKADEVLGSWDPAGAARRARAGGDAPRGATRERERLSREPLIRRLRFSIPVAVAVAAALLVAGMFIGGRLSTRSGVLPAREGAVESSRPVVVVCGLPEVEVVGNQLPGR